MSAVDTLILGVGNVFRGDDGIGVRLLEGLDGPWHTYDGGVGGLGLMSVMEGYRHVIILDAIDAGLPPGSVFMVDPERVPPPASRACHQVDLRDLLHWRRIAGIQADVTIIGIQPEWIGLSENLGLTLGARFAGIQAEVRRRIESIIATPHPTRGPAFAES